MQTVKSKDHAYFTQFIMWAKLNSTYFYVSTKNDARFRDIAKHTSPERINLSPRTIIATHSICISQGNTSSTSAYISSRMMKRNYLLPKRNVVGIIYCKLYVLQVAARNKMICLNIYPIKVVNSARLYFRRRQNMVGKFHRLFVIRRCCSQN